MAWIAVLRGRSISLPLGPFVSPQAREETNKMARFSSRGLAVALAFFAAFGGVAPTAQAQSIELHLNDGRRPPPRYYSDDRYDRRPPRPRGCSPRRALEVADYFGMRRARVVDVSERRVVVAGIGKRGERTRLVLANNRECNRLN
jgi:hypothetical protein